MFKPQQIKLSKDIYYFKKENKIPYPTDYALILGGLFTDWGHKPIFEIVFDKMHVDLYIPDWNKNVLIEVYGERKSEQYKADGNRDGFLVHHQKSVQRICNKDISEIPLLEQIRLYFKGLNIFEQQLQDWKENGIPDYLKVKNDVIFEDHQDLHQDLHEDIDQWFH